MSGINQKRKLKKTHAFTVNRGSVTDLSLSPQWGRYPTTAPPFSSGWHGQGFYPSEPPFPLDCCWGNHYDGSVSLLPGSRSCHPNSDEEAYCLWMELKEIENGCNYFHYIKTWSRKWKIPIFHWFFFLVIKHYS